MTIEKLYIGTRKAGNRQRTVGAEVEERLVQQSIEVKVFHTKGYGETRWVKPPDTVDRSRAVGRVYMCCCRVTVL